MKFQCLDTCQGRCCKINWDKKAGFVFLTKLDRIRLAAHFAGQKFIQYSSLGEFKFTRFTDKKSKQWFLNKSNEGNCIFFVDGKCSVYQARPTQCRTFPFWPELVHSPNNWNKTKEFCPGIDKGNEVSHAFLNQQITADLELCPK